ncbi:MAG: GTP-binding protein, partial [Bdellovibrionales bacterium]|nr:GTP-binding protein [Bdellovibrionales bacterium]
MRHSPTHLFVRDDGYTDLVGHLEDVIGDRRSCEIVVEAEATLEPVAVAELFYLEGENGEPPDDRFAIQTMISVVDCSRFLKDLNEAVSLQTLELDYDEFDDRSHADVIVEQIEFSDLVILNRISDLDELERERVLNLVEWLNPAAQIEQVPPEGLSREFLERVMDVESRPHGFDLEEVSRRAGWMRLIEETHPKKDRGAGLSGFTIRARRPLHPERFQDFLSLLQNRSQGHDVVRVKGWVWIATRNSEIGLWAQAGEAWQLLAVGAWLAATPMREWPSEKEERDAIMADWVPPYGDR